jgi:two-component system OmpR family response regulator
MTSAAASVPSILVADDDPVSLQYLEAALRDLGCTVTAVASGTAALTACAQCRYDLLLLDRRMPDGGGATLLRSLRQHGVATTAIATSAQLDTLLRNELVAAGYAAALTKPISMQQLRQLLSAQLSGWQSAVHADFTPTAVPATMDLLDDATALVSVGGDANILSALRTLLAQELRSIAPRMATQASASPPELGDWLHRLRASCRYCGVPLLAITAQRLESRLTQSAAAPPLEFTEFLSVCARTVDALDAAASRSDQASSAPS